MNKQNWYVRRGDDVKGPYPAGLVSRYILLGRIRVRDEVSQDGENWEPVGKVPDLIPQVMLDAARNPHDEEAQHALQAARRWADERVGVQRMPGDRRGDEGPETVVHRWLVAERHPGSSPSRLLQYATVIGVIAVVVMLPLLLPEPEPVEESQCEADPVPGINWSGCQLGGKQLADVDLTGAVLQNADLQGAVLRAANLQQADLSYANLTLTGLRGSSLREAKLIGADLRGADLFNTDLQNADLSYANLTNAALDGALFDGARLSNAIWADGSVCARGSVGECRQASDGTGPERETE